MILGIGLHFLPRLRGVKLAHPGWVAGFFWLLACGLVLRMGGQFLLAIPSGAGFVVPLGWMVAGGAFFQAVGVWGTLGVLVKTFRAGRPLEKNRGFLQIVPLLFVAGLSLAIAQGLWSVGAFEALRAGLPLVALPAHFEGAAVDLMLFGFVPAMALAMSSRLFPLTFGTRPPDSGALAVSAGLLACGVVLTVAYQMGEFFPGWAEGFQASGMACGAFAVRIFYPRKKTQSPGAFLPGGPAAWGVLSAFAWFLVSAGGLLLLALQQTGIAPELAPRNLARHALGIGFMSLLIISVGWKMLPGFGGQRPKSRTMLAVAIVLGNLAALSRVLSMMPSVVAASGAQGGGFLLLISGALGFSAVLIFAGLLWTVVFPPERFSQQRHAP